MIEARDISALTWALDKLDTLDGGCETEDELQAFRFKLAKAQTALKNLRQYRRLELGARHIEGLMLVHSRK